MRGPISDNSEQMPEQQSWSSVIDEIVSFLIIFIHHKHGSSEKNKCNWNINKLIHAKRLYGKLMVWQMEKKLWSFLKSISLKLAPL